MAKNSSSLVKYGSYSVDEAEEEEKERAATKGGKWLKLGVGKTTLRVVPPMPGKKWKRVVYVHYVDVAGIGNVTIVCPRTESKKKCPVCEEAARLDATGRDKDSKKAFKLQPKRRIRTAAVVRGHEDDGAKIWEFGPQIEDQLIAIRKDEDIGGDFVNPVDGIDLIVVRKGEGTNTSYKVAAAKKGQACALAEDATRMNEIIAGQPNIEATVKVLAYDDIVKKLRGEDVDDDDDDKPVRGATRSRSVEDELEDDDDDGEFIDV